MIKTIVGELVGWIGFFISWGVFIAGWVMIIVGDHKDNDRCIEMGIIIAFLSVIPAVLMTGWVWTQYDMNKILYEIWNTTI